MSEGNIEIVRRVYAAFNDRRVDVLAALLDPEFRWQPNREDPERKVHEGFDESVAFLEAQWHALPGLRTEVAETSAVGSTVVAVVHHTARIPGSDSEIERREAHVWTLYGNKVVSLSEFATRTQALEAAGLSE